MPAASPPSAPAIKRAVRVSSRRGTLEEQHALARLKQRLFRRPAHDSTDAPLAVDSDPTPTSSTPFVVGSLAPQLGRYVVLAMAGAGGMGRVLRCYDPQLDREVAIKTLARRSIPEGDARLVREAQAMARLSHPNVLAIYDVAQDHDTWFIVMEYVEGQTLAQWLCGDPRPTADEILSAFLDAAEGLAAAHVAGLVHRDFKPGNVLVSGGSRPRVRVMDFGLARADDALAEPELARSARESLGDAIELDASSPLTRPGTVVGTPAYMAVEQHEGDEATPRSDQYSFCVALWEGIHGARPFLGASPRDLLAEKLIGPPALPRRSSAPRWLDAILRRGLAPDPADRFATMDELAAAIRMHRSRRRRASLLAGGLGVLACTTLAGLAYARSTAQPLCASAADKLAGIWDAERSEAARASFAATGVAFADDAWQRTHRTLDAYAEAWVTAHTDACEATHVRGEQSPERLDVRMACLARRLSALDTLGRTFADADADVVERAPIAARSLASVDACADVDASSSAVPLPDDERTRHRIEQLRTQLAEANVLHDAGRFEAAERAGGDVLEQARELGYEPLLAEALVVVARFHRWRLHHEQAEAMSAEATFLASRIGHDEIAIDAALEWVRVVGHGLARYEDAQRLTRWAEALAERTRDPARRRTQVTALAGLLAMEHGSEQTAEVALLRVIEELERDPDRDDGPLANALHNLGIIYMRRGQYDRARPLLERTLELGEQLHGARHPAIAPTLVALGGVCHGEGDVACARRQFERALAVREPVLGRDTPASWDAIVNLGVLALEAGEHDEATAQFERALTLREHVLGSSHPDLVFPLTGLGVVALRRGELTDAEDRLLRAVTIVFETDTIGRLEAADALSSLCDVYGAQDRWEDVAALADRGLDALASTPEPFRRSIASLQAHRGRAALNLGDAALAIELLEPVVAVAGVPAAFRFTLARALDAVGREPERALQLAREALAGSTEDHLRVDAIESFIRERTRSHNTAPR